MEYCRRNSPGRSRVHVPQAPTVYPCWVVHCLVADPEPATYRMRCAFVFPQDVEGFLGVLSTPSPAVAICPDAPQIVVGEPAVAVAAPVAVTPETPVNDGYGCPRFIKPPETIKDASDRLIQSTVLGPTEESLRMLAARSIAIVRVLIEKGHTTQDEMLQLMTWGERIADEEATRCHDQQEKKNAAS